MINKNCFADEKTDKTEKDKVKFHEKFMTHKGLFVN